MRPNGNSDDGTDGKTGNALSHGKERLKMARTGTETGFPLLKAVEAHWERLRQGQIVPFRSELDPRGIESALSNTFIAERIAPGHARLRLAGMHVNALMGMEVRGMPLTALFEPRARQMLADALDRLFDGPMALTLDLAPESGFGRPPMSGRAILLPLRNDLGDVSRVLGCIETTGTIGRTPRRFIIRDLNARSLRPAPLAPDYAPKPHLREIQAFAESSAEFRAARPSGRAPWLRVVKPESDKE